MSAETTASATTRKRSRATYVSLITALAVVPRTFQRSLFPRSTVDQGIVTGMTVAMVYGLSVLLQDAGGVVADAITSTSSSDKKKDSEADVDMGALGALLLSAAAYGAGYFVQKKYPYRSDERLPRSTLRTGGYWVQNLAIASGIASGIEVLNDVASNNKEKARERNLLPWMLGAGLAFTLGSEYLRTKNDPESSIKNTLQARPGRSVLIGAGVAGALAAVVLGEKYVAGKVDSVLENRAPALKKNWLPAGHIVAAGVMGYGLYKYMQKIMNKIESGAETLEQGFRKRPTSPYVSGSASSLVAWESLSIEGRRHVSTRLTKRQIAETMGQEALDEPVRLFIGLDSAPTEDDRVELALKELERTGAYDRSMIVVISPTGSGYVNYVMSEAVEYLTRGSCASITMQYSKRPSPLSLDRVDEGHIQYRKVLNGIKRRLATMPEGKRPRIVLFGESLGAWTSQDAFLHSGTDGLEALGIDRALWIGTPQGSKWKDQILAESQLNIESGLAGSFDNFHEITALPAAQRDKLRYVMITHYNDPIAQFGLDLLVKQPDWVDNPSKRSSGMPASARYRTPGLFVQMLIDMKNALKPIPGQFVASGHDYRGDLAECVQFAYHLKATSEQMEKIEAALRANELSRQKLIEKGK